MTTNSITIRWPAGLHLEDVFIPTREQYARFSYYAALLEEQARDIVRDKMSRSYRAGVYAEAIGARFRPYENWPSGAI